MADRAAFFDAAKLILSYMDRAYTVSFADKPKVDAFLHEFLALAFAIPPAEFAAECNVLADEDDVASNADGASEAGTTTNGAPAALLDEAIEAALNGGSGASGSAASGSAASTPGGSTGGSKKARKGGDLRKKALRKAGDAATGPPGPGRGRKRTAAGPVAVPASVAMSAAGSVSTPSSRAASPTGAVGGDGDSVMMDGAGGDVSTSREASPAGTGEGAAATPAPGPAAGPASEAKPEEDLPEVIVPVEAKPVKVDKRRTWNVFCNSTLYCMLRLFQVRWHALAHLFVRLTRFASRSSPDRARLAGSPVAPEPAAQLGRSPRRPASGGAHHAVARPDPVDVAVVCAAGPHELRVDRLGRLLLPPRARHLREDV